MRSCFGKARRIAPVDPYLELKRAVHASLVEALGPQLFDQTTTEAELARLVRAELHVVMDLQGTPLSVAEKARLTQEISDDVPWT